MLLLRNKEYISYVNHHLVTLIYCGNDESELYIDYDYQGICPFAYIKKQINKIEENPMFVYNLKNAEHILFKELREPGFDKKI